MEESPRWAFASPPCAVLSRVRAAVPNLCVAENIRKNWVYTPADWKSQLVIRRKSLYHGITNLDLSPAERWGAMERPALKLERVQ